MRFWRAICTSVLALVPAFAFVGLATRASAQVTLTSLFTNGSAANRINIVFLSEGYTAAQLSLFTNNPGQADAVKMAAALLATAPYSEYSNYFNAYAISIASPESGSDHPAQSTSANTYFNSSYDASDRVITVPPNQYDANYNDGLGKIRTLLTNLMPQFDLPILVVNDFTYGGSGTPPDVASNLGLAVVSLHFTYPKLVAHESGHAFAGLGDEYSLSGLEGVTVRERPNATMSNTLATIRWKSWISNSTPIPTPDDPTNYGAVGLFQGAQYSTSWFRPEHDCIMRAYDLAGSPAPFCQVCSEAIVKSIYSNNLTMKKLLLVDSFSPASTNFTITSPASVPFTVTPLQPSSHALAIQWYTNNVAVTGATNPVFTLQPSNYPNGILNLRAFVHDTTALVRNDPGGLLTGSALWSLNISQSSLRLVNPRWANSAQFSFSITGSASAGFTIQGSTNLTAWSNLSFNSLTGGVFNYTNSGLGGIQHRFYRAVVTN